MRLDDLRSILERQGIEIYEDLATANAARAAANATESPEADPKEKLAAEAGLDLSLGVDPKSQDPASLYLREIGSVPLLTREGEVTIAKRIERGQLVVMKVITRSPIVIKELIAVGGASFDSAGTRCNRRGSLNEKLIINVTESAHDSFREAKFEALRSANGVN